MDDEVVRARIGRELGGHYRLDRLLGSGGMGSVYEARNTWTDRRVAVKVLHAEHSSKSDMVARFLMEARAASAIRHPNIVDVLDMGIDERERTLYIVQEFLEGEDLATRLDREGSLRPRATLDALVPVMGALVSAHRRGIIHRDVKPENVFLARTETGVVPKLIDFGIARFATNTDTRTTRTGTTIGTPQYMSPEQARGDLDLDARTDVWSLGVVLYECLSGVRPFEAANYNLVVVKIVTQAPKPLRDVAPSVPAALAAVVDRALAPDRDARWPDVRSMLDALLRCRIPDETTPLATRHAASLRSAEEDAAAAVDEATLPAFPLNVAALGPGNADETQPASLPAPTAPPPPERVRRAWVVAAVVAMVATLTAGVVLGRRSAPTTVMEVRVPVVVPARVREATVVTPPPMVPEVPAASSDGGRGVERRPAVVRAIPAPSAPPPRPRMLPVPRSGNNAPILPP